MDTYQSIRNDFVLLLACQNKNTHLNQAIHEEQEAILELRVQLRLLQSHKLQQELTVPPSAEQAPPTQQPSPEARGEDQPKRPAAAAAAPSADIPASTNGKTSKDPSKPSPNKDRRDTNMWNVWCVLSWCLSVTLSHSLIIPWRLAGKVS